MEINLKILRPSSDSEPAAQFNNISLNSFKKAYFLEKAFTKKYDNLLVNLFL